MTKDEIDAALDAAFQSVIGYAPKHNHGYHHRNKVAREASQAKFLKHKGLSNKEIGYTLGRNRTTIAERLKHSGTWQ